MKPWYLLVGHLHLLALKLHESRTLFQPLHLEECLAHSRCPINTCPLMVVKRRKHSFFFSDIFIKDVEMSKMVELNLKE